MGMTATYPQNVDRNCMVGSFTPRVGDNDLEFYPFVSKSRTMETGYAQVACTREQGRDWKRSVEIRPPEPLSVLLSKIQSKKLAKSFTQISTEISGQKGFSLTGLSLIRGGGQC